MAMRERMQASGGEPVAEAQALRRTGFEAAEGNSAPTGAGKPIRSCCCAGCGKPIRVVRMVHFGCVAAPHLKRPAKQDSQGLDPMAHGHEF